jgi:hypothetical protein
MEIQAYGVIVSALIYNNVEQLIFFCKTGLFIILPSLTVPDITVFNESSIYT